MVRKILIVIFVVGFVATCGLFAASMYRLDVYIPRTARCGLEYGCIDWDTRYASATTYQALHERTQRLNDMMRLQAALQREQNGPNPDNTRIDQIERFIDDLSQKLATTPEVYDKWHWHWKGYDGFAVSVTPVYYAKPLRIILPLWLPALLFVVAPATFFIATRLRRRHRRRSGRCLACGYDLRASSGACPECGQIVKSEE